MRYYIKPFKLLKLSKVDIVPRMSSFNEESKVTSLTVLFIRKTFYSFEIL